MKDGDQLPRTGSRHAPSDGDRSVVARNYLTIEELSLRTTLSVSTLRRLFKRGLIVGYQPGGPRTRILFPNDAVERAATVGATSETETEFTKAPPRGPRPKWQSLQ
jgi:excisionase family DNA binding protein